MVLNRKLNFFKATNKHYVGEGGLRYRVRKERDSGYSVKGERFMWPEPAIYVARNANISQIFYDRLFSRINLAAQPERTGSLNVSK